MEWFLPTSLSLSVCEAVHIINCVTTFGGNGRGDLKYFWDKNTKQMNKVILGVGKRKVIV